MNLEEVEKQLEQLLRHVCEGHDVLMANNRRIDELQMDIKSTSNLKGRQYIQYCNTSERIQHHAMSGLEIKFPSMIASLEKRLMFLRAYLDEF